MHIIGLVGGVAAGKSLVADCFARLAATVLNADAAAHDVLRQPEVIAEAHRLWGDAILGADGQVDRNTLARIVFGAPPDGPRQRARLERLVHPRVRERFRRQIDRLARQGSCPAAVIDAPLLLEAEWGTMCDRIVFVHADRDTRLARARARGWTEEQFAAREDAQMPLAEKEAEADIVIDNSGSPEETYRQVEAFWKRL
jgi:dephospho-CoA kinase